MSHAAVSLHQGCRADLAAVRDRDPACQRYIEPLLYFKGFHAIQIELNRALYFDEAVRARGPGWSRTEKGVARVIADLLDGT